MTIHRLTREEKATYLLGQALLSVLRTAPRDPDMVREIDVVCRWLESALTPDEIVQIAEATGYFIGESDDIEVHANLRGVSRGSES